MLNDILQTEWMDEKNELYNDYNSSFLKKWYKGGLTHCNRYYQGKTLKNVTIFDVNSMYPYHMISNYYPIGKPIFGDGGKEYPLKLYSISWSSFETKSFPLIKSSLGKMNFYKMKSNVEGFDFVTQFELDYILKHYNFVDFKSKVEMSFKQIHGKILFGEYIDYLYKQKKTKTGPEKAFWKLLLNSFYGKFGTKTLRECKLLNNNNEYESEEKIVKSSYYIPIAIFITAYSRVYLASTVAKNYKHFYYCDTDSLHVNDKYKYLFNFNIGNVLGQWKEEATKTFALYRRAKQYMLTNQDLTERKITYLVNPKIIIKTAGSSRGIFPKNMNYDLFRNGYSYINLQKKKTDEGVLLHDVSKSLPNWQSENYQDWRLPWNDEVNYVLNPNTNKLELLN